MDELPARTPPPRPVPMPPLSAHRPPAGGRVSSPGARAHDDGAGRLPSAVGPTRADDTAARRTPRPARRPADGDPAGDRHADVERGLRALVGAGPSQLSRSAALRARDACRPTPADLAAADRDLPIVRRGWRPDGDLPGYRY